MSTKTSNTPGGTEMPHRFHPLLRSLEALRTEMWVNRMRTAEMIFQNFDFGEAQVKDSSGWTYASASDEIQRTVFLDMGSDAGGNGISERVSFRIEFAEDQSAAVDVSAIVQRTGAALT